ncbi:MAG: DUF512 domain-containing protein [Clostridia bacterium]|nr:DUF512 domain-containing protein [Clostridia bacterium]
MVFVTGIVPRSPAEKAGIRSGDAILSVNGNEINDVLDYQFYTSEVALSLEVKRGDDTLRIFLGKGEYEDPGMEFCTYLMDDKRRCRNGCMFCFIDQNPKGMRETIYFKDDDERLSFLQGNYVTLTNLTEKEIDRIIKMRLSPVNISVHTVNPELRVKMMKNRFAGDVLSFIPRLNDGGIQINAQLVLCRGINDGAELERSLNELISYEHLESCACVPAGLTDHREGLYPLIPYDKESALETLDIINKYGDKTVEKFGMRKVFASDEFYLLAGLPIPDAEYYEDYPQIENGVGMLRSFEDEFLDELEYSDTCSGEKVYIATGKAAYPTIKRLIDKAKEKFENLDCRVFEIENRFFGKNITVSGLITGKDLLDQLSGKVEEGGYLLLPSNMFKADEEVFLDDVKLRQVRKNLKVKTIIAGKDGYELCQKVLLPS